MVKLSQKKCNTHIKMFNLSKIRERISEDYLTERPLCKKVTQQQIIRFATQCLWPVKESMKLGLNRTLHFQSLKGVQKKSTSTALKALSKEQRGKLKKICKR